MKLLIKPMWRGVFQMYPFDFKRKSIALTNYPSLSAILQKNPLFSMGSFCFFCKRMPSKYIDQVEIRNQILLRSW